jgi:arylsulfatase A-like enzyme
MTRKKYNVIQIISDDQGYWALGCNGNDEIQTPNLDALAHSGVVFENCYCTSPVCSPARASLMTGKIPSQHGVLDWIRKGNSSLDSDFDKMHSYLEHEITYPELLAEDGYQCGYAGKWHLGDAHTPSRGFKYWDTHASGASSYYNAPMALPEGDIREEPNYITDYITDSAISFLSNVEHNPFCLVVGYTAPHSPWGPNNHPKEVYDEYYNNCAFSSVPKVPLHPNQINSAPVGYDEESRRSILSGYYAAITEMDRNIGRIMSYLDEHGLRDSTLVIFTSDNGMNMGHHGIYGKGNGTFPQNMFETAVKVPAIISLPEMVGSEKRIDTPVSHYDFLPTILDITCTDYVCEALPGRSLLPMLGRSGSENIPEKPVIIYNEYGPVRMIRSGAYKYIHRYPYGPNELYNLEDDPDEFHNLDGLESVKVMERTLRLQMEAWFRRYSVDLHDGRQYSVYGRGQNCTLEDSNSTQDPFSEDWCYFSSNKEQLKSFEI